MKLPEIVAMVTAIVVAATSIISLVMQAPDSDIERNEPTLVITNSTAVSNSLDPNEVRFVFIDNGNTYIIDMDNNVIKI
jgi:type II secretory pathway component PulM